MENQTKYDELINKYGLYAAFTKEGIEAIGIGKNTKTITTEEKEFIKAHKPEIRVRIYEIVAEKVKQEEEEQKHMIYFYVHGWESHKTVVDDRKDLEDQFKSIADNYDVDGITYEHVKEAYYARVRKIAENEQRKVEEKKCMEALKKEAQETGEKVKIRTYGDECSDPDESCDYDIVTEWMLPNGEIEITRYHTY